MGRNRENRSKEEKYVDPDWDRAARAKAAAEAAQEYSARLAARAEARKKWEEGQSQ